MRNLLLAGLALATLLGAGGSSARPEVYAVRIPMGTYAQVQGLVQRGFDFVGADFEKNELLFYADANGVTQLRKSSSRTVVASPLIVETLDSRWKHPDDILTALKKVETSYPDLAYVTSIGKSVEGNEIYAIRLTDSFASPARGKAVVLFDFMHHAREVMTPEVAFDIVDYLTQGYATDKKVRQWLLLNEIWVVPMVNPDGNGIVWSSDNMWRKNSRGGYGVDINRNYPYAWGSCKGSSGNRNDEQYRGPSAASEPETQALISLAKEIVPVVNISYHTASELVIYPMSCPGVRPTAAQRPIVEGEGKALAATLKRDSGSGTYRPGYSYDLLYPVDGGSIDWMYNELQTLAYCVEMNSVDQGFQPSYSAWRDTTVKRNRAGWQWALERVNRTSIRVFTEPGETVEIRKPDGSSYAKKKADPKGWAHFIVQAGNYQAVDTSGKAPTEPVTVTTSVQVVRFR